MAADPFERRTDDVDRHMDTRRPGRQSDGNHSTGLRSRAIDGSTRISASRQARSGGLPALDEGPRMAIPIALEPPCRIEPVLLGEELRQARMTGQQLVATGEPVIRQV